MARKRPQDDEVVPLAEAESAIAQVAEEKDAEISELEKQNRSLKLKAAKTQATDQDPLEDILALQGRIKVRLSRLQEHDERGYPGQRSPEARGDFMMRHDIEAASFDQDEFESMAAQMSGGGVYQLEVRTSTGQHRRTLTFSVGGKSRPISAPSAPSSPGSTPGVFPPEMQALKDELATLKRERERRDDDERMAKLVANAVAPLAADLKRLSGNAGGESDTVALIKAWQGDPRQTSELASMRSALADLQKTLVESEKTHATDMRRIESEKAATLAKAAEDRFNARFDRMESTLKREEKDRDKNGRNTFLDSIKEMADTTTMLNMAKRVDDASGMGLWKILEPKLSVALQAHMDKLSPPAITAPPAVPPPQSPDDIAKEAFRQWLAKESDTTFPTILGDDDMPFIAAVKQHGPWLVKLAGCKTQQDTEQFLVSLNMLKPDEHFPVEAWSMTARVIDQFSRRLLRIANAQNAQPAPDTQAQQAVKN